MTLVRMIPAVRSLNSSVRFPKLLQIVIKSRTELHAVPA